MKPIVLSALVAGALAAPAQAASLPQVESGHRPGPDVLYAPPATAPQMENDGPWRAAPILVSGATAYRDGEFLYQDFLYDDHGARGAEDPTDPFNGLEFLFSPKHGTLTYPTDPKFASNAADLVELRVRPLADATAFRVTLNTLADAERTAFTIALGDSAVPHPWPHGAGVSSPGELFLTVHGTTAELTDAATGTAIEPKPTATVDARRRQFDVRVPHAAWDPGSGTTRMAAGVGLWGDDAYLQPNPGPASETTPGGASPSQSGLFNVAFRASEPLPKISEPGVANTIAEGGAGVKVDGAWWRERAQGDALAAGDVSPFFADVDFGKLAAGVTDDSAIPREGHIDRILVSSVDNGPGVNHDVKCLTANVTGGDNPPPCTGRFLGRLQPYALYVPKQRGPRGYGITLEMHGLSANHNEFLGSRHAEQFGERGSGSIVASPLGRGPDGQYMAFAEVDVFEMWADVARHYELDPDWAAVSGYSMGGQGTYRLAGRYPDLFARAFPIVGPTFGDAVHIPSLRNIPVMAWYAGQDELVNPALAEQARDLMEGAGIDYDHWLFNPAGHITLGNNDEYGPATEFLGEHRVDRDPPHVTFVVAEGEEDDPIGRADHAYWVEGVVPREGSGHGTLDVRSHGFGLGDAPLLDEESSGGSLQGGSHPALAYVRRTRGRGKVPSEAKANRLDVTATDVRSATIDVRRARVDCAADLRITTNGPLDLRLAGCGETIRVAAGSTRAVCASRRVFRIHPQRWVPRRRRVKVVRARVVVNGRRVKVRRDRRGRLVARVDLRGLPRGRFTVRIVARLRSGKVVRVRRVYRTCRPG
ncbi:MAG TPA: dienelactone hydrolase family protein [Solirubrobacteraceae bacterium]|jgi:hypothetical protein